MSDPEPGLTSCTVPLADWYAEVAAAKEHGYDFFDWLSAVDHTGARGDGTWDEVPAERGPIADSDAVAENEASDDEPAGRGMMLVVHLYASAVPNPPDTLSRVMLHTLVPDAEPVSSVTSLFAGAAWHERETHEMFGVTFTDFADGSGLGLRPLLLPEGFEGTPLAKSFILTARASKPWPGAKEPGESDAKPDQPTPSADATDAPATPKKPARPARKRRKILPPGVPDPSWGPRPS